VTLRIAITGAQGTGKSTLARAIADRLAVRTIRAVSLYQRVGADAAHDGQPTGSRADADAVMAFARLHEAREATATGDLQVFDRCLLDTLAYAHVLQCLPPHQLEALHRATLASCARMTRLVWLRVTTDYPVLNATDETPEFRRAIDAAIGTLGRDNAIPLAEYAVPPARYEDVADATAAALLGR
jgi:predicted ATPase